MNLDRSLIFAYLEEDNIQRAYFRVRPLLTLDGDIQQEALHLWPNEGGLRIVPDRNEQHTFKTRMRSLGAFCVIDLRNQPPEAGKIRTNKNYRPERGEVNQYILYSDTVHELPENTFYQLLQGEAKDYVNLAAKAITPLFYIQQDDTLYGPVKKSSPTPPNTAEEAAGMLFEIACPDGVTRDILCIEAEEIAETVQPVVEEATEEPQGECDAPADAQTLVNEPPLESAAEAKNELPIGETLHILEQGHDETIKELDKPLSVEANLLHENRQPSELMVTAAPKDGPLGGTPLIRTPLHVSAQQSKNHTQEVINNQWNVGKYEPPAQNLPAGTTLHPVDNPVEQAIKHMRTAWNNVSTHAQLTDFILSLEGCRPLLETELCRGSTETVMQHVLRQRLQDLEAERLSALCELDRARRDTDAYKQELMTGLANQILKETGSLEEKRASAENNVNTLKAEINALTIQRDALLAKVAEIQNATLPATFAKALADMHMTAPVNGSAVRITPISGHQADLDEMIDRLSTTCSDAGLKLERNAAIALLVLIAVCPRIGFACSTPAPAATLARNLASSMGWQSSFAHQYTPEQQPMIGARPVDPTPAILLTNLPYYAPLPGATKVVLSRSAVNQIRNAAYDVSQWPIWMLPALPFVPAAEGAAASPVSNAAVSLLSEHTVVSKVEFDTALEPVLKAALPLSGSARKEMFRFVAVCAGLMEGGLPVAVDWAISLWIVPGLERGTKAYAQIREMLDEYPLSASKL